MQNLPVSLVVMTWNEAANIARCLDSVPFVAEKLVVDSGSSDRTVELARACGARVVEQAWLGFGAQRNACSTLATHDWILVLDADEYLSPELAGELAAQLPALMASDVAAGIVRRSNLFMGRPMRWYRPMVGERKARLYHRARARWSDVRVHESLRYQGASVTFHGVLHHVYNPTLVHNGLKSLRYAELKARDWLQRGRPLHMWACPFVFIGTFLKDYLLRLAFLDGWRGFVAAHSAAAYAIYKRMRYYEMRCNPPSLEQADQVLARHGLDR